MTSTPVTSLSGAQSTRPHIARPAWLWIALTAGLLIGFHVNFIWRMLLIATNAPSPQPAAVLRNLFAGNLNPDWSHALVIPFISLYYLYQKRRELMAAPRSVFWPGLAILFAGMLSYAWWIAP